MADTKRVNVDVEGRRLSLSNLDKVLYPATGFTKGEVIDYYTRIAPVLLPHVANRPATRTRWPDGVAGPSFFEKNAPSHTPEWVRTVALPTPGSTKDRDEIRYILVDGLPTLVWLANLAALELHVPQWTVGPRGAVRERGPPRPRPRPGRARGPDASAPRSRCCSADELVADGLDVYAKTSGSKGLQLYVALHARAGRRAPTTTPARSRSGSRPQHPKLIVHRMEKAVRKGKVLIDWSQNAAAKTTVAPYSLRARERPTVSTPLTWDEVEDAAAGRPLAFTAAEVLDRVEADGDLFAGLLSEPCRLP